MKDEDELHLSAYENFLSSRRYQRLLEQLSTRSQTKNPQPKISTETKRQLTDLFFVFMGIEGGALMFITLLSNNNNFRFYSMEDMWEFLAGVTFFSGSLACLCYLVYIKIKEDSQ